MAPRVNGPKLNNITNRFSSRDCLGIESVSATISGELCPVVNTVTPRAFYWAFLCWIYYDFYKNSGIQERDVSTFDKQFLKRQDYFFVLSNLLIKDSDQFNLVGKQKTSTDINNNLDGPYPFNLDYFKTTYGGMQYYNAGCMTMGFIGSEDDKSFPKPSQYGEQMALAFEEVIKDTSYYKYYRLKNIPVPKDVLIEYGNVINLGMKGFDKCKALLRTQMFEKVAKISNRLNDNAKYAGYIYRITGRHSLKSVEMRHILYDYYSPRGDGNSCPEEILDTVKGWEIVIGRQYFTAGIEMIWKFMLGCLTEPLTMKEWKQKVLDSSAFSFFLEDSVESLIGKCGYSFEERESVVEKTRKNGNDPQSVENGLKLMLSVYNRFIDRDDLGDAEVFLHYGAGRILGTGAIALTEWFETIDKYRNATIGELLSYIMTEFIVEQHKRTCFEKLTRTSQNVNGFYFELIDEHYMRNEYGFQVDYQGIRMIQLMQVMADLDMFDTGN